jgi:hypothetical protein
LWVFVGVILLLAGATTVNAADRNDFTLISITVNVPRMLNIPGGTLTAVNKGSYWEIPYHFNFSRSTVTFKWQLKASQQNSAYGNALMDRVNNHSTVWAKKGSGSAVNLGGAAREGNQFITKSIAASLVAQNPGWPCSISLGVRYNNETMVYSDPTWYEVRVESMRSASARAFPPGGSGGNDGSSSGQLTWSSPITSANFPDLTNTGVTNSAQRQRIENKKLSEIISSVVIARDDGNRCSACHFQTAAVTQYYRPTVPQNSTNTISSTTAYSFSAGGSGTSTWAGANGFADRFIQRHASGTRPNPAVGRKPLFLRKLFEKWKNDGYLP